MRQHKPPDRIGRPPKFRWLLGDPPDPPDPPPLKSGFPSGLSLSVFAEAQRDNHHFRNQRISIYNFIGRPPGKESVFAGVDNTVPPLLFFTPNIFEQN
jgi:hypothetical protein